MTFFNFFKVITAPIVWLMFPTKVHNKGKYFKQKAVICCNHFSAMDVALIAHKFCWGKCHCIAKGELFVNKFVTWFLTKCGAIPIDRGESDLASYRACMQVLKEEKQLIVFPEGTRNRAGEGDMLPFLPGAVTFALRGNAPIIPMVYYKKIKPFRVSHLLIGDAISLEQFKDMSTHDAREAATAYLREQMVALKNQLDEMMQAKKRKRKQNEH